MSLDTARTSARATGVNSDVLCGAGFGAEA
jgi:hypothetical protein